jgi:uncharacterized protein (TIGR03083 family)
VTDWGAFYREHVAALSALAPTLTEEQLATVVPGSPAWTVHEVFAHVAGGASDFVTGRMEGAPSPEWTSRHVSERAPLPVAELVAELQSHQDAIVASMVDNPFPASAFDIAVHHTDIREGLGLPVLPERLWLPVADAMAGRAGALADAVPSYELFRGVFSRRSRNQMRGWGTGLSADDLDQLCIFGPRDDDQPVPA